MISWFIEEHLAHWIIGIVGILAASVILLQRDRSVKEILTLFGLCGILIGMSVWLSSYLLFIASTVVLGLVVAWMGRDELVKGRLWIVIATLAGLTSAFIALFVGAREVLWGSVSVIGVSASAWVMSYRRSWTSHPLVDD